ncbi:MAG: hypothetical protein NTU83_04225 [Candidatus Hydrogenedentes bacterium]|nr:hypothetical protein [Candidatus Hydrogenedentota bacterium]
MYIAYRAITAVAAPIGAAWLTANGRHRRLRARWNPPPPNPVPERPVWVHACSVGEVGVARPLLAAMRERWPHVPLLLTVSTAAGYDFARDACPETPLTWFPFDTIPAVRKFLTWARPRTLAIIETELWPNVLRETRRTGAAVVLLNGRRSDKHYGRYTRFALWIRPVVRQLSAAGMQNEEYARRLVALGADPSRVRVTGNTKFDGLRIGADPAVTAKLRIEHGLSNDAPILVFGSTRPGDETLAARCWKQLRETSPALRLIVAPRHVDRLGEALAPFDEPIQRRSAVKAGEAPSDARIIVLDGVGELVHFYALATVAVVGGSFFPGVNGHNPLEPVAAGAPVVFGPYMRNFMDPARELVKHGGAIQVATPDELLPVLERLLGDPEERRRLVECGRAGIEANRGAIQRSLDLIEEYAPAVRATVEQRDE